MLDKSLILAMMLLPPLLGYAQQEEDNSFGGWHFVEIAHKFGNSKVTGMLYFEHENYQYKRLDCWYLRPGIRYNVLSWLKLGLSYDYLKVPDTYGHRLVPEVTGTLKGGGSLSPCVSVISIHGSQNFTPKTTNSAPAYWYHTRFPILSSCPTWPLKRSPGTTSGARLATMSPVHTISPTLCRQKLSIC